MYESLIITPLTYNGDIYFFFKLLVNFFLCGKNYIQNSQSMQIKSEVNLNEIIFFYSVS